MMNTLKQTEKLTKWISYYLLYNSYLTLNNYWIILFYLRWQGWPMHLVGDLSDCLWYLS